MKKILLFALVLLSLISCRNSYENALPNDALGLVRINPRQLISISDLVTTDKAEIDQAKADMLRMLKENMSMDDYNLIKPIIDDPNNLGISLIDPVYILQTGTESLGIIAKMGDLAKAEEFLNKLAEYGHGIVKKENGKTTLSIEELTIVATEDVYALYVSENKTQNEVTIQNWLDQDADHSLLAQKQWEWLKESDDFINGQIDLAVYASQGIPTEIADIYRFSFDKEDHGVKAELKALNHPERLTDLLVQAHQEYKDEIDYIPSDMLAYINCVKYDSPYSLSVDLKRIVTLAEVLLRATYKDEMDLNQEQVDQLITAMKKLNELKMSYDAAEGELEAEITLIH